VNGYCTVLYCTVCYCETWYTARIKMDEWMDDDEYLYYHSDITLFVF